ncbi:hypothetical protein ABK040_002023 [Willaertia magna]
MSKRPNNNPNNDKVKQAKKESLENGIPSEELCGIENTSTNKGRQNKHCKHLKAECPFHKEYHQLLNNGEITIDYHYIDNIYDEIKEGKEKKWANLSVLYNCTLVAYHRSSKKHVKNDSLIKSLGVPNSTFYAWIKYEFHKKLIEKCQQYLETKFAQIEPIIIDGDDEDIICLDECQQHLKTMSIQYQNNNKATNALCNINYLDTDNPKEHSIFEFIDFNSYLKNITKFFRQTKPTTEEKVVNLLVKENRYFTEKEILHYIKTNYNLNELQSIVIEKKVNENNELIFSYRRNLIKIPTFTKEPSIQLTKLKTYHNNKIDEFNFNNFLDLPSLKEKILSHSNNLFDLDSNPKSTDNFLSVDIKNDFLIENFRKIFKLEADFLHYTSPLNRIVYCIVNSFMGNSLEDTINIWLTVRSVLDKNFEEKVNGKFKCDIRSFVTNLDNYYPIYFKSHLNGFWDIKYYPRLHNSNKEKEIKEDSDEKTIVRTPNYTIINNEIYLNENRRIGRQIIRYNHCFTELQNDLRQVLFRYKNISTEDITSFVLDMDHIPYKVHDSNDNSGFMVGFCDQSINQLLKIFNFEDRMIHKVLNYHKLTFSSHEEAKKVNYNKLKSEIDHETLLQWEKETTQKVADVKNRVDEQLQRKLSKDELDYLLTHNSFSIKPNNFCRKPKNDEDPIHNKYMGKVFDHNHHITAQVFNYLTSYLKLSNEEVSTDEEMYNLYQSIKKQYGSTTSYILRYLLVAHIHLFGRGFTDRDFNIMLGFFEKLYVKANWNYDSIFEELTYWLNRDPIVDSEGNLIIYYSNAKSSKSNLQQ